MNRRAQHDGFTIIETMLFLAITGLLVMGLLVGIGSAIGTQRYRDSVVALQSLLQQQYHDVVNIKNSRPTAAACPANSTVNSRGQGDCLLLGRYLTIDGGSARAVDVIGTAPTTASTSSSYIDVLRSYTLTLSDDNLYDRSLNWQTHIAWPRSGSGVETVTSGASRMLTLLVLRSPETGMIYSFTRDTADISPSSAILRDMIALPVAAASVVNGVRGQSERLICIAPTGWTLAARSGIVLKSRASSANAIEAYANDIVPAGASRC